MQTRRISKLEWAVIVVLVGFLVVMLNPCWPNWRETTSRSCHLCGNREISIRDFRWWRLVSEKAEPVIGAQFPVPVGHVHDWWQYGSTYSSFGRTWSRDRSERYRDGRQTWKP